MKKILALCLCLLLLLSACGNKAPDDSTPENSGDNIKDDAVQDLDTDSDQNQDSDSNISPDGSEDNAAAGSDEGADNAVDEQKKLAESCIDKSVEELYNLIGEPQSSDYAPSCNGGDGAEDGNLYYDGFIVYTLKEGDSETVVFVE